MAGLDHYPSFDKIGISPVSAMAGMTKEKAVLVPRPILVALSSHEVLIRINELNMGDRKSVV